MSLIMQLPKEGRLIYYCSRWFFISVWLNFLVIIRELLDGISQVLNKMVILMQLLNYVSSEDFM